MARVGARCGLADGALQRTQKQGDATTESTLTAKGQTTVSAEVRGSCPGRARYAVGLVRHARRHHHRSREDQVHPRLAGMLKPPKGKHVAVEDMNPWR
jgi:hypothetical protein